MTRTAYHNEVQKEVRWLHESLASEVCEDIETEIELAVDAAIDAGQGVVPCYHSSGIRTRETQEPVFYAIAEGLEYEEVFALLMPLLKGDAAKPLRRAIAHKWAERMQGGISEARRQAREA